MLLYLIYLMSSSTKNLNNSNFLNATNINNLEKSEYNHLSDSAIMNNCAIKDYLKSNRIKSNSNLLNAINLNLKDKYSVPVFIYDIMVTSNLIRGKISRRYIKYQELLVDNETVEYLRKVYIIKEIMYKIKKLNDYYQNYSIFFLIPTIKNFKINHLMQKKADFKADIFYKFHQSKDEKKEVSNYKYKIENKSFLNLNNRVKEYIENNNNNLYASCLMLVLRLLSKKVHACI